LVAAQRRAWVRWSSGLLIAAGVGYALHAIRELGRLHYTTVHGDFWILYDRFFEIPFPGNVLAPENGHSMVLPSLIWLANMHVFRGDEAPLFAIALASLVAIAALLIDVVRRDRGRGSAESALLIVSALAATFWLAKLQILLSAGFTMICAFPIIGLLLGVRNLTPIGVDDSGAAIRWPVWAGAVISSFSFGTGLAAWPALGLIAWARRASWRSLALWCAGMLVCLLVIRGVLPRWVPEGDQAFPGIILAPLENLKHWLQLLGSPLANTWVGLVGAEQVGPRLGLGSGIAGAGLAGWGLLRAWGRRRDLTRAEWTGAALVLFAGGAAALIAIGKTSSIRYFPGDQFSSRYLWWTAYFWLGVIWLLARAGRLAPAWRSRAQLVAAALCLAGVWPAQRGMVKGYGYQRAETEAFVASLVSGAPFPRFHPPRFFEPKRVLRLDAALRERRLGYYARDGYRSIGAPLDESFEPGSATESARLKQNHFYASGLDQDLGVRIAGWLENGPADLILLTDRSRVVRGLGGCFGGLAPEPVLDESFFAAFAPAASLGEGFEIWAVRGREARRVIPRLTVPRLDRLDEPEDLPRER
jgi:hypothetical protein